MARSMQQHSPAVLEAALDTLFAVLEVPLVESPMVESPLVLAVESPLVVPSLLVEAVVERHSD